MPRHVPTVLAVDTVSAASGVALCLSNGAVFARDLGPRGSHAEALLPVVLSLLEESTLGWEDIELLAAAEGPGSFTGVRVGVSFVLGVSDARDIPAVGVGSLDILARGCYDATGLKTGTYVIPSLDVRRGEVAMTRFRVREEGHLSREMDDGLAAVSDPGPPPPSGTALAGDGAMSLWPDREDYVRWPGTGAERAVAAARLAIEVHLAGNSRPPVP
ncbi:MAG TPA: tRNA (adenosine(37)-N6)-threonylcarbamoyltransferase complex dimerization subunit type 1 TsaB, partial [Candidatus Eisenbacteria bacterium]|nr:tRNA (adenosine(37)-N6)-threonylcarbamoyltransferase complex dimerization subunit type 1 TsaB [Candidatus Eisenbacteria bacterium]